MCLGCFSEIPFKVARRSQPGLTLGAEKGLRHWAIGVLLGMLSLALTHNPVSSMSCCLAGLLFVCCPVVSLGSPKVSLLFPNEICACGN